MDCVPSILLLIYCTDLWNHFSWALRNEIIIIPFCRSKIAHNLVSLWWSVIDCSTCWTSQVLFLDNKYSYVWCQHMLSQDGISTWFYYWREYFGLDVQESVVALDCLGWLFCLLWVKLKLGILIDLHILVIICTHFLVWRSEHSGWMSIFFGQWWWYVCNVCSNPREEFTGVDVQPLISVLLH